MLMSRPSTVCAVLHKANQYWYLTILWASLTSVAMTPGPASLRSRPGYVATDVLMR